jgi:hypothetical protein
MSHLLSEISIKNYKSIIDESFELSAFTPFVGYNNAGKSNMLEAIKWLLRKTALPETAFYTKTEAVEMEGKISGISETILEQLPENQRTSIQPFLFTDSPASPSIPAALVRAFSSDLILEYGYELKARTSCCEFVNPRLAFKNE